MRPRVPNRRPHATPSALGAIARAPGRRRGPQRSHFQEQQAPRHHRRPETDALILFGAFAAMYRAARSFSESGVGVVVDVGHHDAYSQPLGILRQSAQLLAGLPVLFVGIRCPADVLVERRRATWGDEPTREAFEHVQRWEEAVHRPGIYDMEVDTSVMSADECADEIDRRRAQGPGTALQRAAAVGQT